MIPLKHLSGFWKTLEIPLINCGIHLFLTSYENCFKLAGTADNQEPPFAITDTKLHVPLVTLSTEDNAKLLQQLKTSFKRMINWSKYQS